MLKNINIHLLYYPQLGLCQFKPVVTDASYIAFNVFYGNMLCPVMLSILFWWDLQKNACIHKENVSPAVIHILEIVPQTSSVSHRHDFIKNIFFFAPLCLLFMKQKSCSSLLLCF